jgi:hypothetical protein
MDKIYKYPIHSQNQIIQIPVEADFLSCIVQDRVLCLYFIGDQEGVKVPVMIVTIGTGWEVDNKPRHFLGTVQQPPYVWHVFLEEVE